jgi:hypothetical protein
MQARGAVAILVMIAGARPAFATPEIQAAGAFAVARDPSGQRAAATADALLLTRVKASPKLRLIEPARVLSGDPRTREEETLERARAALADGRRTYDAMSLDQSIARLGQAVSLYQQTGPLVGDTVELKTALAYLGAALVLRGSPDEGESTFIELLTIDGAHQLEGFPPTVLTVYERATQKLEKLASGAVEIFSTPPYAAVYLDGRFEGVTPLTLKDLVSGTHYLRIEKVGYTVHGQPLEISPNQQITSQTRLSSIKRGAELRDLTARCADEVLTDGMGGALRQLARELVADTVLFVSVTQSGSDATFTGAVFDAATGTRLATERAVLSIDAPNFLKGVDELVTRVTKAAETGKPGDAPKQGGDQGSSGAFGLGSSGGNNAPPPPPAVSVANAPPPVEEEGTPATIYLGWTLVGVGAAGVILGAVFGGLAKATYDDFRLTQQTSPDLPSIQDTGKTWSLAADLSYAGGAVFAIGGATVLLIELYSQPKQILRASGMPIAGGGVVAVGGEF